jgi:hypothetical protein
MPGGGAQIVPPKPLRDGHVGAGLRGRRGRQVYPCVCACRQEGRRGDRFHMNALYNKHNSTIQQGTLAPGVQAKGPAIV